jgi:hypothetical protein
MSRIRNSTDTILFVPYGIEWAFCLLATARLFVSCWLPVFQLALPS